jgi:hypothetical protein
MTPIPLFSLGADYFIIEIEVEDMAVRFDLIVYAWVGRKRGFGKSSVTFNLKGYLTFRGEGGCVHILIRKKTERAFFACQTVCPENGRGCANSYLIELLLSTCRISNKNKVTIRGE